jgi:DME family drug/metabolite transporter
MIGELAALGAALSWTVSAVLYKKALSETKPISANIVRLACTTTVLLLFLLVIGRFGVVTSLPIDVAVLASVSGIIGLGLGDTLYMVSLKSIGVVRAVPITCTYPLFNLLWTALLGEEQITLSVVLGAVAIVLGIWLLSQDNETKNSAMSGNTLIKGVAFALATAVFWSVSITMINVAVKETGSLDNALAINTVRVTAIAIVLLASAPLTDREYGFLKVQKKTLITLILGGIIALGLGWFFLTYSFVVTLGSRAVPISSTTPLFSTLFGIVFLHEKVTVKSALGSLIIVVGIFLIFAL